MFKSKKWLFGLSAMMMCLGLTAVNKQNVKAWEEYPAGSYIVCTEDTQLYTLPDNNSDAVCEIEEGSVASVLTTGENYYKVNCGGWMGYLHRDLIGYDEEEIAEYRQEQQELMNEEVRMMAAMIQCEAGGELYEGKVAVGACIMNRVRSAAYPDNIADVIYQPGQFGPAGSRKFAELLATDTISDSCRQAALEAYKGLDNIGGLTHFRRAGGRDGMVIGNHVFY